MARNNCSGCDWEDTIRHYLNDLGLFSYRDPFIESIVENACVDCRPKIQEHYKANCSMITNLEWLERWSSPGTVHDFFEGFLRKTHVREEKRKYLLSLLEKSLDQPGPR